MLRAALVLIFLGSSLPAQPPSFARLLDPGPAFPPMAIAFEGEIQRGGRRSHCRRKWKAALDPGDLQAEPMLNLMRRLWKVQAAVKARAAERRLDAIATKVLLATMRGRRSRLLVSKIRTELDRLQSIPTVLPKSPLGKALTYLKNQWPTLFVFVDDHKTEIDTNAIERVIRPIAIERRNWHVAGSPQGGRSRTCSRSPALAAVLPGCTCPWR
jgi:hypothetical protein